MKEKKKANSSITYTTNDEKNFINKIGTFGLIPSTLPKIVLLGKYREILSERKVWGDIDKIEIMGYIDECIKKEKRKSL